MCVCACVCLLTLVLHADAAGVQGAVGAGLGHPEVREDKQVNIFRREDTDVEEGAVVCLLHPHITPLLPGRTDRVTGSFWSVYMSSTIQFE